MATEDKMKKCRNCSKEVKVDDEAKGEDCTHCGWNELKARAEVRKRSLLREMEEEDEKERKKKNKGINIFGW